MARPRIGEQVRVSLSDEDMLWVTRMAGVLNESIPDTVRLIIKGARESFGTNTKEKVTK